MKNFLKVIFFLTLISFFMDINASLGNEVTSTISVAKKPLPVTANEISELFNFSPIGDQNSDVYFFIKDALLKEKALSNDEVEKWIKTELEILKANEKTSIAGAYETQLGHILGVLCIANQCDEIILYQKNGLVVAKGRNEKKSLNSINKGNLDLDRIGSLAPNEESKVGISTFSDKAGNTVKIVTAAIYYKKQGDYAFLNLQPKKPKEGELIGYVRFITQ